MPIERGTSPATVPKGVNPPLPCATVSPYSVGGPLPLDFAWPGYPRSGSAFVWIAARRHRNPDAHSRRFNMLVLLPEFLGQLWGAEYGSPAGALQTRKRANVRPPSSLRHGSPLD